MQSKKQSLPGFTVISEPYSKDMLTETERRRGTMGELGHMYEMKILLLVLYRAIREGYDFTLDTNIENVGAFDDVVFTYKESDGIPQSIYLQAKHKEGGDKKINYVDLIKGGNGDFSLYKYFIDYVKTIKHFPTIINKYFIIYTNVDFNCGRENDGGFRIHKKSEKEKFVFKKLDLSEHKPLEIFYNVNHGNFNKHPNFYQFSETNANGEDEKSALVSALKSKFEAIDEKEKKLTLNENELESMLEGYIQSLIFAVDQFDQENLGNLVKEEIKQDQADSLIQEEVNYIFEYSLNEVMEWKQNNQKPLIKFDDFFNEGKEKFRMFPALLPTLVDKNKLNPYNIQFKVDKYEELNKLLVSEEKLWLISTNATWLYKFVVYQTLKRRTSKRDGAINYTGNDYIFLLTCNDLFKNYEILLKPFKTNKQSILIIEYEFTKQKNPETADIANEILKTLLAFDLKHIIFIVPDGCEISKQLKKKNTSYHELKFTIDFKDLTTESQNICLTAKKICFQGMEQRISLQQMLDLQEFPVPNKMLSELNLDTFALEILLKNSIIEVGCEEPKLSCLESAYYQTHKHLNSKQLNQAIVENPQDIFAFVGDENDVKSLLPPDQQHNLFRLEDMLHPENGGCIVLGKEHEEQKFQQLCYQVDGVWNSVVHPSIHLIHKGKEEWIWKKTYNRDFYIERYFEPIVIDQKKLKEELLKKSHPSNLIMFSGITMENLLDLLKVKTSEEICIIKTNIAIFEDEEHAMERFGNLENFPDQKWKSIHWLKINELQNQKQIHWYRSYGDLSPLRQLLSERDNRVFSWNTISEKDMISLEKKMTSEVCVSKSMSRVTILADEPGMGKTTTLTRMAELIKTEKPLKWVIKIDLNKFQTKLTFKRNNSLENFVNLLSKIDQKLAKPLTRCLLMYQLICPGHVTLLWDGFDEIKSDRQDDILALFEFIKTKTKARIWITTRRHDQRKLEDKLSTFAYPFKTLEKNMQINFLRRFWEITLKLTTKKKKAPSLEQFAELVLRNFEKSTKTYKERDSFISIPLRARILAEIYQEKVEEAVLETKPFSEFLKPEQLGLGNLYQQFIARKYDIYLCEKVIIGEGLDDESKRFLSRGYTKAYGILALKELFDKRDIKSFVFDKDEMFSLNILSRIGLIQGNEKPANFVHRTFAEYFAGKFLAEQTKKPNVRKFVGIYLFRKEFGLVRRFYDHFLTKNLPLHRAVLENDVQIFNESARKNYDINITDAIGRSILHLAAQEDRFKVIQHLQRAGDIKLVRDKLGKTALHYAANFSSAEIINQLLNKLIDIDLNSHIFRCTFDFDEEIGSSIFDKPDYARSKLIELVNERDIARKTPLYYAAYNESWEQASRLCRYGADIGVLSKEQKLEFFGFLIRKFYCLQKEFIPVTGLLSIHVIPYDLHQEPGKMFENQPLLKRNSTFVRYYLLFFLLEYGHSELTYVLRRNINIETKSFQIANVSCNLLTLLTLINSIRINDKHILNDTDYLTILKYFCECGREIELKCLKSREEILYQVANLGFIGTFQYLFELEENETKVSRSQNIKNNKDLIYRLFSNLRNLNYDNSWLQNLISDTIDVLGWTRLHLAARNKYVHSIGLFFNPPEYENINRKDTDGFTPLTSAASIHGKSKFIESYFTALKATNLCNTKLLYEIMNDKTNIYGMTALHFVIKNEDYASAEVLLKNIKDIGFHKEQLLNILNIFAPGTSNVLSYIPVLKNKENIPIFFKLLFNYMQSFNLSSQQCVKILNGSKHLLYRIIRNCDEEEALSLLKCIENLPLVDDKRGNFICKQCRGSNDKPLHAAARKGECYRTILSLLKYGAIFNAYNIDYKTPLDVYKEKNESHRKKPEYQRTEFLLSSLNRLFELAADEHISEKLGELKNILSEIKRNTWIEPESILNARNRDYKTLLKLCKHKEVMNLLLGLKHNIN